jgi:hypothetical protein
MDSYRRYAEEVQQAYEQSMRYPWEELVERWRAMNGTGEQINR